MTNKNAVQGAINEAIIASVIQNNSQAIEDIVHAFTNNLPIRKLRVAIASREELGNMDSEQCTSIGSASTLAVTSKFFLFR